MTCTCHRAPVEKILRDRRQWTDFKVYIVPLFRQHQTLKLQKYGIADPQLFQTGRVCWAVLYYTDLTKPSYLFCFSTGLEASYLRVRICPLTPTRTSTLSQSQFHLPGIEWPHQASSSSSNNSNNSHHLHNLHSPNPGRKWGAPLWTVWAALAAPMMAVTGRIHGVTSILPLCLADPLILRTEKALL